MAEIPKIVSQRLQAMAQLKDHPDPNLLSAFVERSLGKNERNSVLEHLFRCANCREVVSLSATQLEPSGAVSIEHTNSGWLSRPALRWLAAGACVIVVGAAVTIHQKRESRLTGTTIAQSSRAADSKPHGDKEANQNNAVSLQTGSSEAKPLFEAKGLADAKKATVVNPSDGNRPLAAQSPVEMADARSGSPLASVVPGRAKDALVESQDDQSDKLANTPSARSRSLGPAESASNAAIPPGLAPRWTLSSDGTLQRSLNSGASWQTIVVSRNTVVRALAANGLDIWVGGSGGALFHSSDAGEHWTQVQPVANGEALEDDIIGVEFTDTLHGKLTSSVEEIWSTADAGQTWQKQ